MIWYVVIAGWPHVNRVPVLTQLQWRLTMPCIYKYIPLPIKLALLISQLTSQLQWWQPYVEPSITVVLPRHCEWVTYSGVINNHTNAFISPEIQSIHFSVQVISFIPERVPTWILLNHTLCPCSVLLCWIFSCKILLHLTFFFIYFVISWALWLRWLDWDYGIW